MGSYTSPLNEVSNDTDTELLLRFNGADSSIVLLMKLLFYTAIGFGGGAYATGIELADFPDFGCEIRLTIGSVLCVW